MLLNFPSNDAVSGYSATETAFNLMLMRHQLAEKNIATLVLMAQPRNTTKAAQQRMLELDALLKPLLGECQVELHSLLVGSDGGLASQYNSGDGVHLNDAGHKVVADAVLRVIQSNKCVTLG